MTTKIHGSSDDNIDFDGDIYGEISCYGTDDAEQGVLIICSNGTMLEVKYGKNDMGIWGINVIAQGDLFDRIELCTDEDAKVHSDVVYLKDGAKWAYAANGEWEKVS